MGIETLIKQLIDYGQDAGLIEKEDEVFVRNRLLETLGIEEWSEDGETFVKEKSIEKILGGILDYAEEHGLISGTNESRDLFDTKIMSSFVPYPRDVIKNFKNEYAKSPQCATDKYYDWNKKVNYVRAERIAKDRVWTYDTQYGTLDISINLSKPEKDPRDIAAAGAKKSSAYPKCQLCLENTGYAGRIGHPARQNLIPIPMNIQGDEWYLQYSPYGYYNEHCIVFNGQHVPMKIDAAVFGKLFDIIDMLPHYFVGSNADLPIVGGSILSHEHFQGGCYTFAMAKAPVEYSFEMKNFPQIKAGIVKWPMSVIRLSSKDRNVLEKACNEILVAWRKYTDESVGIFSETQGTPHNTITPIARKTDDVFECDLVLRNNRTSEDRPLGIFHPNPSLHHIKKENIGLIEVMGLAILPSRLATELDLLKEAMLKGEDLTSNEKLKNHAEWAENVLSKHPEFSAENAEDILREEVGAVFEQVLEDAGVFKRDEKGIDAFKKFCLRF